MRRIRTLAPFLFGFMLATIVGMLLRLSPAMAQQAWSDLSISKPAQPPTKPRKKPAIPPVDEEQEAAPAVQTEGYRTSDGGPVPVAIERGQSDRQRESTGDGDGEQAADKLIDVKEGGSPAEGTPPFAGDPRLPADRDAFLTPPAGYDALAFQIELNPATDARPARLTALEPYAAVGRRAGSWVVFPTVEAGVTGTTNVYKTSNNAKPDLVFDVRPTLLAVTDWQQHALQFKMTGLGSAYSKFSTEDERSYALEGRGRLDISKRANIEVLAAHSLDQEPRSSLFSPADARTPIPYVTDKFALAYNQRFNRMSVQLRGAVTEQDYRPVATYEGGLLSNAERDLSSRELALRAAWSFKPALALFAEMAFNTERYRTIPADGITRDSNGDRFKVGLSFGTQSQIWRGEIATGYGHQRARDGRLADAEGILLEANLGWKPTQLTSVLFKASTDFVTSTDLGQGNAVERLAAVELRHAFQRQLVGIAGLSYQVTAYQGVSLSERTTTAELGFEYYLSQATTLLGRYQHRAVDSTGVDGNTLTDSVRLGVRYRP